MHPFKATKQDISFKKIYKMKTPEKYEIIGTDDLGNPVKRKIKGLFPTSKIKKIQEVLYFGKYNRWKIKDVARKDPQYLNWIIKQEKIQKNKQTVNSIRYWLNKYNLLEKQ